MLIFGYTNDAIKYDLKDEEILGFIFSKLKPASEGYKLGVLTLMIDDFCL